LGRRRVLFRRQSRRRGEGLSLPSLSKQSLLKEWKKLSKKEREERRQQVIEKYYKGSYSAFERDVEARPFHVLRLMLAVGAKPSEKPKAEKPPEKPKLATKPVTKPKPKKVEAKPEAPTPEPETKPKVLTKDLALSTIERINERFSDTRLAHIVEELRKEGYSIDELEDMLMELKKEGKIEWRPDGVIWTTEYAKKARERIEKALSEMAKPKAEAPKTEYAPGTWVKLTWHQYPQLIVEKTGDGYRVWDEWELKWREVSPREIERVVKPDPNAPQGSPEEMASRVKAEELLKEIKEREERNRQERLRMLEQWLQKVKTAGERDPRDVWKMLPPDHPLCKLRAERLETEINFLKGLMSLEEFRRKAEQLDREIDRIEAQLATEREKSEAEKKEEELSPVESKVFSAIEALNKSHGPVHPVAIRDEVKQWGIDYDDIELAIDRLLSKGLIGRDEYGTVWSKKWDAEVSANEELVYNKIKEYTSKTFGGGVTFDELAREMEPIGINRNALDWIAKKLLDQRKIRSLYTPSKGAVLSVPPEPGMFNYREAPDYALEELKVMFRNMARDQRHKKDYEKYMDEVGKIEEELARRKEEREAYKQSILEKARAGTLTYETTPDTNPFYWGNEPEYCMEVDPYVSAKERTKMVAEVMEMLGEKPDREKIFRKYVELFKRQREAKSTDELDKLKDPYEHYFKKNAEAYQMIETVRNTIEKNIWAWGDISIGRLADELKTDAGTAKLALKHLLSRNYSSYEKPPFVIKDGRTGKPKSLDEDLKDYDVIARPENWEYLYDYDPKGRWKPDTRGLRALEKLDFPLEHGDGILEINSLGRAKLEFMDPSHVTLFRGEVDLSCLKLDPGRYRLRFGDGDKSAVTSPHTIVREKGKDGDIVLTFKRFDMESKDEKVMREKKLYVKPTDEKPENYPEIKVWHTAAIVFDGKTLKELLRNANDWNVIEFAIEDGKAVAKIKEEKGEELVNKTGNILDTTTEKEMVKTRVGYLRSIVDLLKPSDTLVIHLPEKPDKPLRAIIDTDFISGEYWVAPYIGDDY
jgi:hypothetical protein